MRDVLGERRERQRQYELEDLERRVHEAEARRLQRVRAMCQNLEKPPEV